VRTWENKEKCNRALLEKLQVGLK